ncbi:MAG: ribosome biogenesis GTPase Der [Gammaproteobacteria bacterium RIFCSPLOWO2_02_FULL_61_13]|nr:MAG: ribosome biogenesis GTPase Der [Gammaproteobacteria bacterium RIFCSPLOWO2_02_FULL_61_13]
MLPIIAIVGRPNVGKSTLFNRILRRRDAVVADQPGVTRDRRYGIAATGGRRFILVDTGGLGEGAADDPALARLVTEQSMRAVTEADAVLWLVDGRAGITGTDLDLAQSLRRSGRTLYLVVNKTEGLDPDAALVDFHRLGVGAPIPIAAAHGIGVSTMIEHVLEGIPVAADLPAPDPDGLTIGIIGRPNVGKSTLLNRMLGEDRMLTFDQPGTTRDSIAVPFARRGKDYVLIDTAGVRRRARIDNPLEKISAGKSLQTIDSARTIIAVIDASEGVTDQDLALLGLAVQTGKSLIIALNKWDGLDAEQKKHVESQVERKLGFADYAAVQHISALHGTGVGELFDTLEQIRTSLVARLKSSDATRLLEQAVTQHSPPLVRGRRIKLRYAHVGGHDPLRIIVHGNQTESVPDAYRRYLEGVYRHALRLVGTPVMIEFKRNENPYRDKGKMPGGRKKQPERKRSHGPRKKRR